MGKALLKELYDKCKEIIDVCTGLKSSIDELKSVLGEKHSEVEEDIYGKADIPDTKIEIEISNILRDLGIPSNLKGYAALKCAIKLCVKDPVLIQDTMKNLYPKVAGELNTTVASVERTMRTAIEYVFDRVECDTVIEYFGRTISPKTGKVTNSEFIAIIAERISMKYIH